MSNPAAKPSRSPWIAAAVCALAALALFQFFGNASRGYVDTASLFWWWISQWLDPNAETEHGWLILGLSAWLLWRNVRNADCGARNADSPNSITGGRSAVPTTDSALRIPQSALAAMAAGLALHALGFVAQQARVSILAFLLFTWAVLRLGGGRRWGGAALFPVAFMVFAIPFNVLDSIGFWLRVWVVDASAVIARIAGIGVLQSGTQLVAPDGRYNYDVAAACSGVRSLTAMAALSLLAGYLNFHATWRRTVIFLLCFPLVYLGNVARIVAIIFAAQWAGPKAGDVAHDIMGYGIFAIVLGGVLMAITLVRRFAPEDEEAKGERRKAETESPSPSALRLSPLFVAGVIALIGGEMLFLRRIAAMPARGAVGVALAPDGINPVELPAFIGTSWAGRRAEVTQVERDILPADTGYSRKLYVSVDRPAPPVFLSIVLSGRDRTSIHRPELCLVGQGWTIAGESEHLFSFNRARFPARVLRVQREVQAPGAVDRRPPAKIIVPQIVVYWFVGGDTVVASHWERVARDSWTRVTRGRADRWAYVLMQTDAADGEAAALARLQAVIDGTLPAFQRPASKPSA
jgi:exosortase